MAFVSSTGAALFRSRTTRAQSPLTRPARMCAASGTKKTVEPLNADGRLEMKGTYPIKATGKFPICRCWMSAKHPICDGSHSTFNEETGSKTGPIVISLAKEDE